MPRNHIMTFELTSLRSECVSAVRAYTPHVHVLCVVGSYSDDNTVTAILEISVSMSQVYISTIFTSAYLVACMHAQVEAHGRHSLCIE
jgi:hypothetical protein